MPTLCSGCLSGREASTAHVDIQHAVTMTTECMQLLFLIITTVKAFVRTVRQATCSVWFPDSMLTHQPDWATPGATSRPGTIFCQCICPYV